MADGTNQVIPDQLRAPFVNEQRKLIEPWASWLRRTWQQAKAAITGSGTAGSLAVFTGATVIGNGNLSGDASTSGGTVVTLANSGVAAGTYGDATHVSQVTVDAKGRVTTAANVLIGGGAIGTVTSVDATVPTAEFAVSGVPITTAGTIAITKQTQSANTVWSGPTTGAAAQPTFRALVAADLPASVVTAGATLTNNELVVGAGSETIKTVAATDGQIPIGKSSDGSVNLATLTAGANITITNAGGSITIAASGGSSTGGSTLIGLERILGDGSTTAFNLPDLAEYVVDVSDAGSTVDPTLYTLSSDLSQVVFGTAPTAGHVLTFEYVVAQLAA